MISIIIPAYNEEKRIGRTLEKYAKYYNKHYPKNYEILVVLNGCRDNTEGVVESYIKKYKTIRMLVYKKPIDKGGAIKKGLENIKGDLVGYTDADGSTRAEIMHRLFATLELVPTIDAVVGSREISGAVVKNKKWSRRIMSRTFNTIINLYFNTGVKDTQCGAKVIRKEMIPKILPNLLLSDMSFDVNFIVDIKKAGGVILEMPIEWEDDDDSTIKSPIKKSFLMFMSITRLKILYTPFLKRFYPYLKPFSRYLYNKVGGKSRLQETV